MKRLGFGLLFLTSIFVSEASAQSGYLVLASIQPFVECTGVTYSPVVRSGCYTVPKPVDPYTGTKDHPAIVEWKLPPKEVEDKVYPKLAASLQPKLVYKKQMRRLMADKHCANCKFVSRQSEEGKKIARYYERQMGVTLPTTVTGFFTPWPFNLLTTTFVCAGTSVVFDAKDYRADYKQEPTQEQYGTSFGSNLLYCSPIGGFKTAIDNKSIPQFLMAALGFSSYFTTLPQGVMYAQQAFPLVDHLANRSKAAPAQQVSHVRVVKQKRSKPNMVAAVQP
jgi:hypothetical protein